MDDYVKMIATVKMAAENFGYLHRAIAGRGFLAAHEKIGEWYAEAAEEVDALAEMGYALGYAEPTIQECVMVIPPDVPTGRIDVNRGLLLCGKIAANVRKAMEDVRGSVPGDVASELDGYIKKWRLVTEYFVRRAAEGKREDEDDE